MIIQLADRSHVVPKGLVEDVLVQVNNLIFPADFYVMEMEESKLNTTQLLLGRPFMKTTRTKIDVFGGSLTMEFEDDVISFNIGENLSSQGIEVPIKGTHVPLKEVASEHKDPLIETMASQEDLNKVGGKFPSLSNYLSSNQLFPSVAQASTLGLVPQETMHGHRIGLDYGTQNDILRDDYFHRPYFDQMFEKSMVNGRLNCLRRTVE